MTLLFPSLSAPRDAVVLRLGERTLTGLELTRACVRHRRRLAAQGVGKGAHVGVWTQPALETMVTLVANAACGVVSVPLDPKLGPMELNHVARDAQPVVTLAAEPEGVAGKLAAPVLPASCEGEGGLAPQRRVDDAPLLILYTSGTTGLPKGAVLTAGNVAACLDGLAEAWAWTAADTVVHALPLFHVHGLVLGLFGALRAGGALHWFPRFEPRPVCAALRQRQSMLFAVPTMYHRLAEAAERDAEVVAGLEAARLLVSGSAPLARGDQTRLERLTGRRVLERYGLTETLIVCAQRVGGAGEPGSVGFPLRGVELRLVDDERRPLTPGDDGAMGEVALRGPTVFPGYLNRPDATEAVRDADGWFYTGDVATLAADGSVRIVGRRATDVIKCGGYKVGAGEVEAALLEHPLVREAAVVGRPDADLGERIVAFVVADGVSSEQLQAHVAGLLSPHKRPREVRFIEALPRNAMGKVQKKALQSFDGSQTSG